jgi:hypothetical protein
MTARRVNLPLAIVLLLGLAVMALLAVEVGIGAAKSPARVANPCRSRAFSGSGLDATIQRVVLQGLDGAACRLGTTREALVLSLAPGTGFPHLRWSRHTIEAAVRAGLLRSLDEADRRGDVPGFLVPALRKLVQTAPLDKLIQGGISLSDLLP